MSAEGQLSLDVQAVTERRYVCCGAPAPAMLTRPPHFEHPHAEGCPNPSLGVWFDRFGRSFRRLHCITVRDGVERCPRGGVFVAGEGCVDPFGGVCCLELRRGAAA